MSMRTTKTIAVRDVAPETWARAKAAAAYLVGHNIDPSTNKPTMAGMMTTAKI